MSDEELPSVAKMAGFLAGYEFEVDDSDLLDALEARGVVSIYFADGSQLSPASQSLRAALANLKR